MNRVALVVVLASATAARADGGKLDEARRAIEAVRFDQAQRLLAEAHDAGGNSPAAMRELYELSATAAIALGQREVAEQYYRRWLALDPDAHVADDVAPKIRDAFASARAYMAAHGRLAAHLEPAGGALDVVVDADPLAMAAAVSAGGAPVPFERGRARVPGTPAAVALVDDRGNGLLELVPDAHSAPPPPPPPAPVEPSRPFVQRWTTWAIPAAAIGLTGAIFGTVAINENESLKHAIDHSGEHYYSEIEADRRTMQRNATLGIVLGGIGAALAIPAAIFYARSRQPWSLTPTIGASTIGVSVRW